jgi:hypothetical protein
LETALKCVSLYSSRRELLLTRPLQFRIKFNAVVPVSSLVI